MKDLLDKLKFNDWLRNEETAPYPSMFYDIPMFIQMSYIQKWLREVHGIYIQVLPAEQRSTFECEIIKKPKEYDEILDSFWISNSGNFLSYQKALEAGIKEALKLIK